MLFEVAAAPGHQAVASAVAVWADRKVATLKTTDICGIARRTFDKEAVIEGAVA